MNRNFWYILCMFSCLDTIKYSGYLSISTMTSSHGNIFRVTGPLCGEFTGHLWIPLKKSQWLGAMFSLICAWINSREAGDLRRRCAHYDIVIGYVIGKYCPQDLIPRLRYGIIPRWHTIFTLTLYAIPLKKCIILSPVSSISYNENNGNEKVKCWQ